MSDNEFFQPISVDFAPRKSLCEWCGEPAEEQLTVIGGAYHNKGGLFCRACGEKFAHAVAYSLLEVTAKGVNADSERWAARLCLEP